MGGGSWYNFFSVNKKAFFGIIILSFLASALALCFIVQQDARVGFFLAYKVGQFMRSCDFRATNAYVNPLCLSVTCYNVRVRPNTGLAIPRGQNSWFWSCAELKIRLSWLSLIFLQRFEAVIDVNGLAISAHLDDEQFPLIDHIKKLFFGLRHILPITAKILKITNARMDLISDNGLHAQFDWSGIIKKIGQQIKTVLHLECGELAFGSDSFVQALHATLQSIITRDGVQSAAMQVSAQAGLNEHKINVVLNGSFSSGHFNARLGCAQTGLSAQFEGTKKQMSFSACSSCDSLRALGIQLPKSVDENVIFKGSCTFFGGPHVQAQFYTSTLPVAGTLCYTNQECTVTGDYKGENGLVGAGTVVLKHGLIKAKGTFAGAHWTITRVGDRYLFGAQARWDDIKALLGEAQKSVRGDGTLTVCGTVEDGKVRACASLHDASLFFPSYGALIREGSASIGIDCAEKSIILRDLDLSLFEGKIKSPYIYALLGKDVRIFCPITLQDCSLAIAHAIGTFSGGLYVTQDEGRTKVSGALMSSELSVEVDKVFMQSDNTVASQSPELDIVFTTLKPAPVQTNRVCTELTGTIAIRGAVSAPTITGLLTLHGGQLRMPCKSLAITHGTIHLGAHKQALVDMSAQAAIGQYVIVLRATGAVGNPTIRLTSKPALSEEKITSLLLTGSLEPSLALAFDLGEHVHARVQKDVSLKNDAAIELDWRLWDNIIVNASRASSGDLVGQLEWRSKW